ncbi:MAG: helix-turn-helix domain-containing protein [archaeon]
MIKEALQQIGLTEGESQVYEALVELGLTSTGKITKKANIASSKVYEVLDRLMKKGLVSFVMKNNVHYYDATPPERLLDFLEEKKDSIDKAQDKIKKLIPVLEAERKKPEERNETVVYVGTQGPKIVLKETIEAGRRGEKLMGFGTDRDPYKDYLPAAIEEHFRDQKKYKVKWHLLFNKKFRSPSPHAEIKYLPEGLSQPVRTMIYGNKVAIVDFHKSFTTVVIEKKEIAEAYRKHFEVLWEIAKK